ncbi:unnamed protein product [Auanema sp. JU1783]|nr:unnamed protein product [Auanema sp. JU1783]
MAPSGGSSVYRSPPTLRAGASFPLLRIIYQIIGLFVTFVVTLIIFFISPVFLIARIACFCKKKSRRHSIDEPISSCCSNHPITGHGPNIGIVIINDSEINPMFCNSLFKNIPFVKAGPNNRPSATEPYTSLCRQWDGDRDPWKETDLKNILNDYSSFPSNCTTVHISKSLEYYPVHLIIIANPTTNFVRCIPNMIGMIANNEKYFDIEPVRSLRATDNPRAQLIRVLFHSAYQFFHFLTEGPTTVLSLFIRSRSSLWKHLQEDEKRIIRKRKTFKSAILNRESSTVLMDSVPEDVIVVGSKDIMTSQHVTLPARDVPPNPHRIGWCVVPQIELVGRAERLLRATSAEMFLTLVAGTIRAYCRDQGISHPPDLGVVMPVWMKKENEEVCRYNCNTIPFPLMLPTGVEGAIPRLWSIQKRLYENLGGHLPSTIQSSMYIAASCLPSSVATAILKPLFSSHSIYFAFYRTSHIGKALEQILLFPSLSDNIKASFIFIQCGYETRLCVSLCKRTFPDVNAVLRTFEKETNNLLDHLSGKILSLPQTTILPGSRFGNFDEDGEMFGSSYLRQKTAQMQIEEECEDEQYTLEELHELLATVQKELDGMRANPQGNRNDYIKKLDELEQRMQRFHQIITTRLGEENILDQPIDGDEVVDNILAPYKSGPDQSQNRRFSREFQRTEEQNMRKSSRSSL